MMHRTLAVLSAVVLGVAVVAVAGGPADATSAPPPVSHITVTERTAHRAAISFYVPAAYYDPGAGGVVRITRGYTPAATPTAGYAVPVTGRTARTTASPTLTADVVYTFAVWVHDHGLYSARRTLTIRTRPDNVSSLRSTGGMFTPTDNPARPGIRLTWTNPSGQALSQIRIVRNTEPTTTGGTVITLKGTATSYTDYDIGERLCAYGTSGGCSTAPVHYWVLAKSATGDYADAYTRSDVVLGSRTVSGTVSGAYNGAFALCCPNPIDDKDVPVGGDAAVDGHAFTLHLPPGVYAICANSVDPNDPTFCWFVDKGNTNGQEEQVSDITVESPQPTLDLTTTTDYDQVVFQ